jgi:hypothetical protein
MYYFDNGQESASSILCTLIHHYQVATYSIRNVGRYMAINVGEALREIVFQTGNMGSDEQYEAFSKIIRSNTNLHDVEYLTDVCKDNIERNSISKASRHITGLHYSFLRIHVYFNSYNRSLFQYQKVRND